MQRELFWRLQIVSLVAKREKALAAVQLSAAQCPSIMLLIVPNAPSLRPRTRDTVSWYVTTT